jgi:hypothetical protein
MGLDMWLPSVFDYEDGDAVDALIGDDPIERTVEGIKRAMDEMYNRLRATGGYYREAYNRSGLLPALGLDWDDIIRGLPDKNILPVDHAKMLLAEWV